MKKTLLSLALLTVASTTLSAELYNGRLSGMSGAGYVTGGYTDGVLLNPSLGANHSKEDSFAFVLNAGGLGSDEGDLIDSLEDLVDYTDYLRTITKVEDLDPAMAETLIDHIERVEDKSLQATASASLVIAIPNEVISVSLIGRAYGSLGAATLIDKNDYALIRNSVNTPFDPDELQSGLTGKGVLVKEYGVAFAKAIVDTDGQKILLGITPKRVTVKTIVYETIVADYDEDDLDADDYTVKSSATSMDAGVTYIQGNVRYGLSVTDLISKDFKTVTNEKFELSPRTTAAVGYHKEWLTAEASLDLDAAPTFGLRGDTQLFRAGIEASPVSWLQLRAGLQRDLEDTLEDSYSLGLGLSPFQVFNLDLAVFTGKNETEGGAIQLGLRF